MKSNLILTRQSNRLRLSLGLSLVVIAFFAASFLTPGNASATATRVAPLSGDTCAAATVINPSAQVFVEDSSLAGAGNDIDPGFFGCAPGGGNDVVYSFTPS